MIRETQSLIDSLDINEAGFYLNAIEGNVRLDDPIPAFDEFSVKLKLKSAPKSCSITTDNFLLQGSIIKASS